MSYVDNMSYVNNMSYECRLRELYELCKSYDYFLFLKNLEFFR